MEKIIKYRNHCVDQIKEAAQGHWLTSIYPAAGIEIISNRHSPCPACGGKDRFRCDNQLGHGGYFCNQCGAGDGFSLLKKCHGWSFPETLEFVAGVLGLQAGYSPAKSAPKSAPKAKLNTDQGAVKALTQNINCLTSDDGTVERYLQQRGLQGKHGAALWLWPACRHDTGNNYPAMAALFTNLEGKLAGIHRTYLDSVTKKKADIDNNKALTKAPFPGAYRGCAIRLYPPDTTLAITEGIETALAVRELTGLPVWAAGSASLMKSLLVPPSVTNVQIWADHDHKEVGQKAARKLGQRLITQQFHVTIHTPHCHGDWLDVLIKKGGGYA